MAVGPNFSDPDTQAAIAAAQAQAPVTEPVTAPVTEPVTKPVTEPVTETPAAEPAETPSAEVEPKTKESAQSPNMDEVKKPDQAEVDKALAAAGFSNDDLGKELADNDGKITPDTVKALKEHFPEAAVDNAVKDMEAQFAEEAAPIKEASDAKVAKVQEMNTYIYGKLAGGDAAKGQANLQVLSEWAKENIQEAELAAINAKLSSGNKILVDEGLAQAVNQWKKGQVRPMMTGDSEAVNKGSAIPAFEPLSRDEFKLILRSDKYQTDPEYAAAIDTRRNKTRETEGFQTIEYSVLRPPI